MAKKDRVIGIKHSTDEWREWQRAAREVGHEAVSTWARAVLNAAARRSGRAEIEVEGEAINLGVRK